MLFPFELECITFLLYILCRMIIISFVLRGSKVLTLIGWIDISRLSIAFLQLSIFNRSLAFCYFLIIFF